jgi:FMN reductase
MSIKMTYLIKNASREDLLAPTALHALVIDGSPSGGGRTAAALAEVGAAAAAAVITTVGLSEADGHEQALAALEEADAVVLGAPVYRAAAAAPLKALLDAIPRDVQTRTSPLAGKAVAIVQTGASLHHFLALDSLRNVLAGFFAAHVVPPGLYVPRDGFAEDGKLAEPYASAAADQGAALAALARALRSDDALSTLRPQA